MSEITSKNCSNPNCKQINPQLIIEFSKNKYRKDGFNNQCRICSKYRLAEYQKTAKGKIIFANANKKYQKTQKGKFSKNKWEKSSKGKKSRARRDKKYRQTINGRAAHNAIAAKYRAAKLRATPKWLNRDQHLESKSFYVEALKLTKSTDIKHHVDHILPLQGEHVSGLHVSWNLQILTQSENDQKLNKFDFTYDNKSWRAK